MADIKGTTPKRTVLITGCSDGGIGASLAIAFHKAGLHVYATALNPTKLTQVSTYDCVSKIPSLDILVNNAGAIYTMPFSDLSITKAKELFDLNVWSYLAVTQTFLPLLLKSRGMIVNQTSVGSVISLPFQSVYNASKAAMATFSDTQRLELEAFGITVVDLKTGGVKSSISTNNQATGDVTLPENSIYQPAREAVEKFMSGLGVLDNAMPTDQYAELVVADLLKKNPSSVIWRGSTAWEMFLIRLSTLSPNGALDGTIKKLTGVDVLEQKVQS
ncbi:putative short-chain dehydrogenases/reductase [Tothia fuscella]|uniref:Short-chain dehydrogenases/reductase n=1 Tax=Tothia fuscella TaxID=1048955 RepID=A0A9P4NI34_9PEZI|nr:putative short-chain dehydrogenases/reductase [Tothia fuscella]